MVKDLVKERRKKLPRDGAASGRKYRKSRDFSRKFSRFNDTGDSDDEEQNEMLSLDALEDE